jgi:hypothetical protein
MPDLVNFMDTFSGIHTMKLYAKCPRTVMLDDKWAAGTANHLQPPPARKAKQNTFRITSLDFCIFLLVIIFTIIPFHRKTSALQVSVSRAGSVIFRSLLY